MATKFDFHKVSESADIEVFQSMTLLDTKVNKVTGVAPRKYAPQTLKKIDGATLDAVLEDFKGYDVLQVMLSKDEGVTVKVVADRDPDYEAPEAGVTRLDKKGGDK